MGRFKIGPVYKVYFYQVKAEEFKQLADNIPFYSIVKFTSYIEKIKHKNFKFVHLFPLLPLLVSFFIIHYSKSIRKMWMVCTIHNLFTNLLISYFVNTFLWEIIHVYGNIPCWNTFLVTLQPVPSPDLALLMPWSPLHFCTSPYYWSTFVPLLQFIVCADPLLFLPHCYTFLSN